MPNTGRQEDQAPVGTVARTLRLLQALAEADDTVTVAGLASRMRLPMSTVHRLLQLLRADGFVENEGQSHGYRAGPELLRVAALLAGRQSIAAVARPIMDRIVAACEETCLLGVYLPHARKMTFVEQVKSPHALRFEVPCNVQLPVVWGSSGHVMLAYMPDDEVRAALAKAEPSPVTGEAIDEALYYETLRQVRSRGHDLTRGEVLANSVGIAAPVFQGDSSAIASLTITIPNVRLRASDTRRLTELVVNGAAELSKTLGYVLPSM
jgi:DNA-binding IclR family transcriptional regulator